MASLITQMIVHNWLIIMTKLSRPKKPNVTLASFGSPPQFSVCVHQLSQEDEGKRLQGFQGSYSLFVLYWV